MLLILERYESIFQEFRRQSWRLKMKVSVTSTKAKFADLGQGKKVKRWLLCKKGDYRWSEGDARQVDASHSLFFCSPPADDASFAFWYAITPGHWPMVSRATTRIESKWIETKRWIILPLVMHRWQFYQEIAKKKFSKSFHVPNWLIGKRATQIWLKVDSCLW